MSSQISLTFSFLMGKNHLRIYSEISFVQVIAISDLDSDLIEIFAEKYHVNA